MHRTTSALLAIGGKKKMPLELDIVQGAHLCMENELNPMRVEKTTGQVKEVLTIQ